jgi:hypothetical protein
MRALTAFCALSVSTACAGGAVFVETISQAPSPPGQIWGLGEGATETMGQTFTVPAGNPKLMVFSFVLADEANQLYSAYGYGGTSVIDFGVMAWDGAKATGPVLFQSGPTTITTGQYSPALYNFNINGLLLVPGQQYVAFVTTSTRSDGVNDFATMAYVGDGSTYAGGDWVSLDDNGNTAAWTTTAWMKTVEGYPTDAVFRATFLPVPEPATGLLLATLPLMLLRRRR